LIDLEENMHTKHLAATSLFMLLLAACGSSSVGTDSSSTSATTTSGDSGTSQPAPVTLRYAGWNLGTVGQNNIERQLLAAYQEENPHVTIEIIERPVVIDEETGSESTVSWDEFFATQAAIDNLPDVYMIYNLAGFTAQGWTEELTDLVEADPDFELIPEDIRKSASFNDRFFALPQSLFYYGFFINRTAINRAGPRAVMPTYGMTYEQLMDAAEKDSKAPVEGGDGIIGISGLDNLVNWMPAQLDPNLGWFTYNETDGYHLDSPAFASAVAEQLKYYGPGKSAYGGYVLDALDPSKYADYFGVSQNVFESGNQSIRFEGSYSMRDWHTRSLDPNDSLYGADIDFIGTPSWNVPEVGNVHRIPVVVDYLAVGKGTDYREEAYKLAKWMGFSAEGYEKRLDLAETNPAQSALNFTPLINREDLVNRFFELYPNMTEFKKIVVEHDQFILESLGKNVPGYWDSRSNALFDTIQVGGVDTNRSIGQAVVDIYSGNLTLADALQKGLNTIANQQWQTAKVALDEYLADN
jgi:ABC-type glycerol-3-phosphate transport system substrate-binding protein